MCVQYPWRYFEFHFIDGNYKFCIKQKKKKTVMQIQLSHTHIHTLTFTLFVCHEKCFWNTINFSVKKNVFSSILNATPLKCNGKFNLRIALIWITSERRTRQIKTHIERERKRARAKKCTLLLSVFDKPFRCNMHFFLLLLSLWLHIANTFSEAKPPGFFFSHSFCVLQYFNSSPIWFEWRVSALVSLHLAVM